MGGRWAGGTRRGQLNPIPVVAGLTVDADAREVADPDGALRMTRGAGSLLRTAQELEHAAELWRADRLD